MAATINMEGGRQKARRDKRVGQWVLNHRIAHSLGKDKNTVKDMLTMEVM